jgi:para-nitrobenzyl esterase
MDITFKFNNETRASGPGALSGANPDRCVASRTMAEFWTSFARTGVPSASGAPAWPAYTLAERASMRIDTHCEVLCDRHAAQLAL